MNLKILTTFTILTVVTFGFQNCSQSDDSSQNGTIHQNPSILNGNGDGYGGKGTYINYDLSGKCSNGSVNEESVIDFIDGQAFLTKKNCQPISPTPIETLEIKGHNTFFGLQSNTLFQKQESNAFELSEVFCRGSRFDPSENQIEEADVIILDDGQRLYARIKAGTYINGELVQSRNIEKVPVKKEVFDDGGGRTTTAYKGVDTTTNKQFTLFVHRPAMRGALLSRNRLSSSPTQINQLTQEEADTLNDILMIEELKCHAHD